MMETTVNILIVGGGPTGFGSAWRLNELIERKLLHREIKWLLVDRANHIGGAAASSVDEHGFTWDGGHHVIYSRYKYFDDLLFKLMGDKLRYVERRGWVWIKNTFVPYPLQENLQRLPPEFLLECVKDFLSEKYRQAQLYNNFKEFVISNFGQLLAEEFFIPHIYKMFAYPAEDISVEWTAHRSGSKYQNVAQLDVIGLLKNILYNMDAPGWSNGEKFPYPNTGGSGQLWKIVYNQLPKENIRLGESLVQVDTDAKVAVFSSGHRVHYDFMISTLPLPELLKICSSTKVSDLQYSGAHIVGLGFRGNQPEIFSDKMWIYDANEKTPYFRFSLPVNYSPHNVPESSPHWSVLCEISESEKKHVNHLTLVDDIIKSLEQDFSINMSNLVTTWHRKAKYAYAIPHHGRDKRLNEYDKWLLERNIFSRGRFGNWKYECGNQDSSFMQGVEAIDKILFGTEELTHNHPDLIGNGLIDRVIPFGATQD